MLESGEMQHDSNDGLTAVENSPLNGNASHSPQSHQVHITSPSVPRQSFTASESHTRPSNLGSKHEELYKAADEREAAARSLQQFAAGPSTEEHATLQPPFMSRGTTQSGQDEEAVVYTQTRMLQDPTGRLRKSHFKGSFCHDMSLDGCTRMFCRRWTFGADID